ncbi:Uncharacterized protein dnm_099000 [Desulfonema magnum]|uniref:Uncharacterized protein n=1 Tax=Desulfonema magnum TaxID=45655 RepID=A0A975GU92_9BACT|nr:Uncharacterized protein dnm_099000 [Desulfonema magnum]
MANLKLAREFIGRIEERVDQLFDLARLGSRSFLRQAGFRFPQILRMRQMRIPAFAGMTEEFDH